MGNGYILTNWHVAERIPEKANLFALSTDSYFPQPVNIPIEKVLFSNKEIELALVRLTRPVENSHSYTKVCLSGTPVKNGDRLTILSSPGNYFPPEKVSVLVTDSEPSVRAGSAPILSIVCLTSENDSQLIAPGSSGGAVLNNKGELVGLVWGRNQLKSGRVEAWLTPVSIWQDKLNKSDINGIEKQIILDLFCR